jgi:cytochrome c2
MNKVLAACLLLALGACDSASLRKSDSELGLNPQQASGHHLYDRYCARCHEAYTSRSLQGPSLKDLYKKPYMPSGTPANDDRVRDVIMLGRSKMQGFGQVLRQQDVEDLIAYLHTL